MKHQYFGDVSDYKKYGILRALTNNKDIKLLVCWMLTPNDKRTDGNNNSYLQKANEWRSHEPEVYDFLHDSVIINKTKNLGLVEKYNIVPNSAYFNMILQDKLADRKKYFGKLEKVASKFDLVFFDPDNGIATPSVVKGRKNSSKYIFLDEIEKFWENGHSLLIYQHFPRVNRLIYINRIIKEIKDKLNVEEIYAIKTTFMVYFLLVQPEHRKGFTKLGNILNNKWRGELDLVHSKSGKIRKNP